jgi:hypothetical protein
MAFKVVATYLGGEVVWDRALESHAGRQCGCEGKKDGGQTGGELKFLRKRTSPLSTAQPPKSTATSALRERFLGVSRMILLLFIEGLQTDYRERYAILRF